ncbi:30S ribosomal protein S5 [Planoprotostelium fungivorum]|uniref:30S ribosomal protein S5 n=1 Tax=Planoprotostelium fungivorum TaxID=1890364 RepID=A0A2P6NSX4_9EUKA|nr:30S ribosomal protein S5 [Planoprotostelium fungivorum]
MIRLTNLRGLQIKSISDGNVIRSPLNNMTKPEGLHTALNTRVQSPTQPIRTKWHRVPDPSTFNKQNRGTNRHGMLKPGVLMSDVDPKRYPVDTDPFTEEDYSQMGQPTHVLNRGSIVKIGRHSNVTAGGRIMSFSALVVMGDGKGTAGIGYGKSETAVKAVVFAQKDVMKNLVSVYRLEDRTISHDMTVKYRATKLLVKKHHKGAGLRGHPSVAALAHCFGFEDLLFKIHGSVNPHNVLRAFIMAARQSKSPAEQAREQGKVFIDITKVLNPKLNETPFKFSNMTPHNLWDDDRVFKNSSSIIEPGIFVPNAPTVDLEEKELRVARFYKRRMEELKKEVPEIDQQTINYAKKVLERESLKEDQ